YTNSVHSSLTYPRDIHPPHSSPTRRSSDLVFITHSDGDHVNGIVAFPKDVKVITHENNKKEQQAAIAAGARGAPPADRLPQQVRSEEHTSELQSRFDLVCRLLLEKKNKNVR